jgi:riboflavin synthase
VKKNKFEVEYMPETLVKTTVGSFKEEIVVNLEKSLRISDLLDGHIVQGHVDCVGKIIVIQHPSALAGHLPSSEGRKMRSASVVLKVRVPAKYMKFIAPKGSVAIDGISLTIVDTGKNWFSVSLVSYTIENTNLKYVKIGDRVNVETDVLAKYIINYLQRK